MEYKISKIGILLGVSIIVCSIIRWFFMYYDPSQMILGVSIGIIVCGFAQVYDWIRIEGEKIHKMNKRLDAFTDWWAKQEMK